MNEGANGGIERVVICEKVRTMDLDTLIKKLTELRETYGNGRVYIQRQDGDWYDDFGVDTDEDCDVFIGF